MYNHKPIKLLDMKIFNDCYTEIEEKRAILRNLNLVISAYNNDHITTFQFLTDIQKVLTNLEGIIKDEIYNLLSKIIGQMLVDGSLNEELQIAIDKLNGISEKKNDMKNNLTVDRIWRGLFKSSAQKNETVEYYSNGQGFAHKVNDTYYIGLTRSGAFADINDNAKLIEVNTATGQIEREVIIADGNHINSISYSPLFDEIYIAPLYSHSQTGAKNNILVYSGSTLGYLRSVSVDTTQVSAVAYDRVTNKLYVRGSLGIFYEIDRTTGATIRTFTLDEVSGIGTVAQSFCVHNNKVAVISYKPNTIVMYDENGKFLKFYNVPDYANGIHMVGECEDISFKDEETIVFNGVGYLSYIYDYSFISIFRADLVRNNIGQPKNPVISPNVGSAIATVHVDSNAPLVGYADGSEQYPFRHIQEGILVAQSNYYQYLDIVLDSVGDYGTLYTNGISIPVSIYSNFADGVNINGVFIKNTPSIKFTKVRMNKNPLDATAYILYSVNSNVTITNSKVDCALKDQGFNLTDGQLNLDTVDFINTGVIALRVQQNQVVYCHGVTYDTEEPNRFVALNTGGRFYESNRESSTLVQRDSTSIVSPSMVDTGLSFTTTGTKTLPSTIPLSAFNTIIIRYRFMTRVRNHYARILTGTNSENFISDFAIDGTGNFLGTMKFNYNTVANTFTVEQIAKINLATNEKTLDGYDIVSIALAKI